MLDRISEAKILLDDWTPYVAPAVTLAFGDSGLLMRRKEFGKWVYRRPTDEEVGEYLADEAW